jgi:rhodanese-related sulfurtransferase
MTVERQTIDRLLRESRAGLDRLRPDAAHAATSEGALLVDIRSESQRAADGVIPEALFIPRNVLEWRLDPASPDRLPQVSGYDLEVIVLCNEGYSSSLVADTLRALGLTRTVDVIGGFVAWAAAGLPVVPVTQADLAA